MDVIDCLLIRLVFDSVICIDLCDVVSSFNRTRAIRCFTGLLDTVVC